MGVNLLESRREALAAKSPPGWTLAGRPLTGRVCISIIMLTRDLLVWLQFYAASE